MPTLGDVYLGFLLANSGNDLVGNFIDGHHPKQTITFCHSGINETRTNVGDVNMVATLVCLLAQSFHVVDLIGFRCAVGRSHRLAAQSASRGNGDEMAVTLLLKDFGRAYQ